MDWLNDIEDKEIKPLIKEEPKKSCTLSNTKCPICNSTMRPGECACNSCGSPVS